MLGSDSEFRVSNFQNLSTHTCPGSFIVNGRTECYHRVIALQFVPNSDPTKFTEVNHKNHIRNDNKIENLEWVTPSANRKDRLPYKQQKKRYTDELPEGSIPITKYKDYSFNNGYFYDPTTKEILKKVKDRFLLICLRGLNKKFDLIDINHIKRTLGYQKFVKMFQV